MTREQIKARQREIRRELRLIAADPSAPGAAVRVQRLKGEFARLAHRARPAPPTEPEPTEAEQWEQIPGSIGKRIRGGPSRIISPWRD